ncbi:apolipoprotein C-III [Carettochelys insculpta]|uniref:apolipoprotein C-III n=1 Tax=Carettochelys insculpta TaxID=44489 RepID=UPI003EC101BA
MKALLLLTLLSVALFAAVAHAGAPEEEGTIVKKVHDYVQRVAQTTKDAVTRVRETEVVQQARDWFTTRAEDVRQYWRTLKDMLSALWEHEAQ